MPLDRPVSGIVEARILIADDDPIFLDTAAAVLSDAGFGIVTARTGQEASIAIERYAPSLVILDCGLDNPSELAIMDALQRSASRIPVMILSARRGDWHKRVMTLFGARSVLAKPVTPEDLVRAVRKVLSERGTADG